jgi:hypothetical protein
MLKIGARTDPVGSHFDNLHERTHSRIVKDNIVSQIPNGPQ